MNAALEKRIKRQVIGKPHRFLAVAPLGFEQTLTDELNVIGIETIIDQPHVTGDGKVEFTAKITEAWKAVAYSRIANRILMHIDDFKAENFREFEKKASEIPWELYLGTDCVLHFHVTCKHSRLYHSDAIAERLEKIVKGTPAFQASAQEAPPKKRTASETSPLIHQHLYANFLDDRCTIWLDLAGEELYKRGHERFVNDAPLKETIAAAMLFEALRMVSSHSSTPDTSYCLLPTSYSLLDPMAGSGTFSLEAAYIANKIIPGTCRDFALKYQPAFKEATWKYITKRENSNNVSPSASNSVALSQPNRVTLSAVEGSKNLEIITSDISERAIEIIKHNVECSPLAKIEPAPITPQIRDFFSYSAKEIADASKEASPIIVLNPPYGKRLDFDAPKLYTKIGHKLAELAHDQKQFNKNLTVAILAPKDDCREGARYTCTTNLLRESPALSPEQNPAAKQIVTSHGGFCLNVFIARI